MKSYKKETFYPGHGKGSGGQELVTANVAYLKGFETAMADISGSDPKAVVEAAKQKLLSTFPDMGGQPLLDWFLPQYVQCAGKVTR